MFIRYDYNTYFVPRSWNGAIYYGDKYVLMDDGSFRYVDLVARTLSELKRYDEYKIISREYFGRNY